MLKTLDTTGIENQLGTNENMSEDPLFCDIYAGDFRLCANSPCLPENNSCGEPIGAHEEGCGSCETAVQAVTWGQIKSEFRQIIQSPHRAP